MEDLTIEQALEKYPYLKNIAEYTLFTSKEEVDKIKNSEKIKVWNDEVSIEFLNRILTDDLYYKYAKKCFLNKIKNFSISFIIYGDTGGSICYNKSTIIRGIEKLIENGKLKVTDEELKKLEDLKSEISFSKFLEMYKDVNYDIEVDKNKYSIPVEKLISFMLLSDEQIDNLCSNNKIKKINDIPKEHFIYAALKFLNNSKVMENYVMPDRLIKHYTEIASLQKIDIQSLNKHLETTDTKYQHIQLNDELEKQIMSGIPENGTDLEKAIFIYIKMCKILTYDDEYFAVNQKGSATKKHKKLDYVSTITVENNKIVCFEFNLIYSKLLNKLGIKFSTNYKNMLGEAYGEGHANLEFRSDKFLVSADSVTTILHGDIMQAKLNQPLVGLKCINKNIQTQNEFKNALTKMYQLIANQENVQSVEHTQTLEELLEEYSSLTNNITDIDLNERLSILIDKVNSTQMIGIDSLSYVLQLRKILFTENQRDNNIAITIIRNNEPFDSDKVAMATAIITLNEKDFNNNPDENNYYYFNPNHELIPIQKEELQLKFSEGIFEYIEKEDPKIPGIIEKGEVRK